MLEQSGVRTIEQDPRVARVFEIVSETIDFTNAIAKDEESLQADQKLNDLKSLMKEHLEHNEDHLHDEGFKPTLPNDREKYRRYVVAHIGEAWGDSKLEYVVEKNDTKLREILFGKDVTIRTVPEHSPEEVFKPSLGQEISGRIFNVSSLLGRISVETGFGEVDVKLFAEDDDGHLERQVDLFIIDSDPSTTNS
jgi:hypothetical protein